MNGVQAGFLAAGVAALLYGLLLQARAPDWRRTLVKVAFAGSLAVTARISDGPPLLALALGLCALADGALAVDPRRTLAGGLVALLLAHVAYGALFLEIGGGAGALLGSPWRLAGAVATLAAAAWLIAWLWPRLGEMRRPAAVFALVAAATVLAALTLPVGFGLAIGGAALLLASDALLALGLRGEGAGATFADRFGWWTYVAAVGSVAWSFLQPWRL